MDIVLDQLFFLEIVDIDMRKKKREDDEKWKKIKCRWFTVKYNGHAIK